MGNPARRHSSTRRDTRRAITYRLAMPGFAECPQCHELKLAHRVCKSCGYYNSKSVIEK